MIPVLLIALAPTPAITLTDYHGYSKPVISAVIPRQYRGIVLKAASVSSVPLPILARLICSESSWNEWLISGPNANGSYDYGIAGFNSHYIAWFQTILGPFNPFRAEEAIPAAAMWLRMLHDEFGNWEDAVVAYKAGARRTAQGRAPMWVRLIAREVAK